MTSPVAARTDELAPTTVRFGRRSTRGVLLGLSAPRVVTLACALLVLVPAVYAAGPAGVAATSPVWGLALVAAMGTVAGRHLAEWVPVAGHWAARRATGQTVFRARPTRPRPAGTLALPGDAARLRLHHDPITGAAMIHDPHAQTLTAVAKVRHPSFVLQSQGDQDRRVAGWGRVLAGACASGRIARVQVLERTLPDSGHGVRAHFDAHGLQDGTWAARQYAELLTRAAPATERHETTVSLALDLAKARRAVKAEGGGMTGAATVLRRELTAVAAALRAAEITVDSWACPDDLAVMLRLAYDPAAATTLDVAAVGRDPATAGPVYLQEHLDHLVTDTGVHAVYWVSEWPRAEVYPTFLSPILLAAGVRRSFCLVAQPLTTAEAMRAVRKERVEYQTDAAHRARIGQLTDAAAEAEWADVTRRESDLIAGHGDLRFAGFLTVTAPDLDALAAARAQVEQSAVAAGCETRLLLGQQAQAFTAAALPLCRGI
jgi:hypothetical protein